MPQEGQLSYEEAIIAKKKNIEENRQEVKKFRSESECLMRQYFDQRREEQQEMRRLVEATMKGHHNTQLMREKLTNIKRKIGIVYKIYGMLTRQLNISYSSAEEKSE